MIELREIPRGGGEGSSYAIKQCESSCEPFGQPWRRHSVSWSRPLRGRRMNDGNGGGPSKSEGWGRCGCERVRLREVVAHWVQRLSAAVVMKVYECKH